MIVSRCRRLFAAALVLLFAAGLSACAVISGKYVIEEPFTEEQVKQIRNNQTTRADILAWFGPPVSMARQGTVMKVAPPGFGKRGSRDQPSEEFFGLFGKKHELTKDHIVYYYQGSSLHWAEIVIYNADIPTTPGMRVRKLWVLINEKTGIVEDSLLRQVEKEENNAETGPEQKPGPAGTGNTPGNLPIWNSGERNL